MIIALLAGVVFLFLQALFPDLPFTEQQTVIFAGLIGAYILGEGLEGARIQDNIKAVLSSHKFQALFAGLLMIAIKSFFPNLPLTEELLTELITILGALILGAGVQGAIGNVTAQG
jgi:uncharacterized membrane protein YdjX (TVP38/TMEM64 family)